MTYAALAAFGRATTAWDLEHRLGDGRLNVFTLGQLASLPRPVPWRVFHVDCDPDWLEGGYWIAVQRIRTPAALIHWAAHLGEKKWISDTAWTEVLHHHADALGWAA